MFSGWRRESVSNQTLIEEVLRHPMATNWESTHHNPYTLIEVDEHSNEYHTVNNLFSSTSRGLSIKKLQRVENPYLLGQYLLKKIKMENESYLTREVSLFHGTRLTNIDGICKYNFNWRLRGSSRGHKFGQGVSFSPEVSYARHYGTSVMILAKVLISQSTLGNLFTIIPPKPYDTTKNGAGSVYVKYEDDDFYPQYVIYYGL